jgi:hypothetical protein
MEKLIICAIYDKGSKRYDVPNFFANELSAKRYFHMAVVKTEGEKEKTFHMFKDDFEMHKVGYFNVEKGKIEGSSKILMRGVDIKE